MTMKKMGWIILTILLSASIVIGGCSNSSGNQENGPGGSGQTADPAENRNEKVKITFALGRSTLEEDNQVYRQIVNEYNRLPEGKAEVELQLVDFGDTGNDHRTWVTTQLVGDSAPDIFRSRYIWTHEDYGKGLIADLTDDLELPNPYNNNKKWRDTFADSIIDNMIVPTSDRIAGIPTYSLSVRLYYNKEIFEEVGITELPETWGEFMEVQEKIKAAGYVPMGIGFNKQGGDRPNWMMRYLSDQTVEHLVPELDLDKNGRITSNEIVYGIDKGIIDFSKPPFKQLFPIMKDWTKYWPEGFTGLEERDATEMFLRGEAAMTLNLPSFIREVEGFFDYGVMRVPYLTKDIHPDAQEKYYEVAAGNPDGVYALPKSITSEKKAAAVDFLMYLTSPKVQQIFAEQLYQVPVLKDAEFPPVIEAFLVINEPFKMNLFGPAFSKELYETFGKEGQLYLNGTMSEEEFINAMNQAAQNEAASLKESQGWSEANNYGVK